MRLLWSVDHGLDVRSKRMAAEHGVTGLQRLVVRVVGRRPGVSPSEVAAWLHVDRSTLTGVLRRLEHGGIVKREKDRADARRGHLFLTSVGERIDGLQAGTVEAAVRRALARVDARSVEAAGRVLGVIAAELDRADR